jgi:hypothetical protein
VAVALDEKVLLSRSLVNRLWRQFFGRGLVHPVDQMHSGNPPSVPGLLQWLADDFAASGYDLERLVAAIVSTKAYRLSSRWDSAAALPAEGDFAVMRVRLLSPRQYTLSLLVATGRADFAAPAARRQRAEKLAGGSGAARIEQYLAAEELAAPLWPQLDPGQDGQTSTAEALYLSNNAAVQTPVKAEPGTLAAQLAKLDDAKQIADAAIRQFYCRQPAEGEAARLADWLNSQKLETTEQRTSTCEQLLWALATAAEFRLQH